MASDKKKDINGYDNHAYAADQTEIGMKPMSTSPEHWRMSKHFVEPSTDDEISSSLRRKHRSRYKIFIFLMILLLAAIIAMGVLLYVFSNDTSSDVFEEFRTTTEKSVTTPRGEVSIVELGVNITLLDREYTEDLGDSSTSAYQTFTSGIISAIDATYESDMYYSGATVMSVSPGSIKVELMMSFNMPIEETERSNAIEFTQENLIPNIENALNENSTVDIVTPLCDIEPCSNGGTCNDIQNSSDYSCTCGDGYNGKSCQNDIDECLNNPCENGGTCTNEEGSYICTCADGFTGMNCEQDINECESNPCLNGGECIDGVFYYTCTCADGFTGSNCEQDIDECVNTPCENGGTCTNEEGSYICTCADGFTGMNCEQDINECASNPCLNGGECTDGVFSYTCTCADGFTGSNCEQECGYRPAFLSSSSRIIGGSPTQLGDWPWMVSLRDRSNVHRCAAVVISNTTAVTAAHCVKKFDTAVLGDLRLSMTSPYHIETDVEAVIHPDYDSDTINNDIAVIKFGIDLEFNDYILPICLASASARFETCYVTGWGHTTEGGTVSDTLQEASVELFDQTQCQSFYPDRNITSTMLCAGHFSGDMDTCQGDTGGPLQCEDEDGRLHLVGITSFGYGCGRPNYPGVYTKVSEYYQFIYSAETQPEPAVEVYLGSPFEITQFRVAVLEYQWILHTPDGNALDIYIFTLDVLRILDSVLIGHGSDSQDRSTVIANSKIGPFAHVYRVFGSSAWITLTTPIQPIFFLPGINALVEAARVDERDTSSFCTNQPCGAENTCMENSGGYSCICLNISKGSSCKDLSHSFGGEDPYSYLERQVSIAATVSCDFDDDLCGWAQVLVVDTLDWNLYSGSEPWTFTGPSSDHAGQSGSYIYVETLGAEPGDTATLVSSKFLGAHSGQCFTFFYYIARGDEVDLGVYFVAENTTLPEPVWTLPGKIENRWLRGEFELSGAGWFIIETTLTGDSRGSISIDDIQFSNCLLNGNIRENITLVPDQVVYMTSPNFPSSYPNHVTQLWTINAPEGYGARFDIDVINLEPSFDRLAIGAGHDPTNEGSILGSWTGHHVMQSVTRISLMYQYWVSFESDLTIRDQGFVIAIYPVLFSEYFISLETGETINVTTPNYPMPYQNSQIVLWLFTAPPQHGLYFRFVHFETEAGRDMVIVGTGESPSPDQGIRLAEMSGFITPSDLVSDVNQAWIMFRPDYASTAASGFFVEIRSVERLDCSASNAFQCPNGQCIPMTATCDGYNDCQDFTDEEHCPACVAVPARCSEMLPYNMTYFPNKHATSAAEADSILERVVNGCPQGSNIRPLACNMLYPECPHFGPTRRPCFSSCFTEKEMCEAEYSVMYGEEWPLDCQSLPDGEQDITGRCIGPDNEDLLNTPICGTRPAYSPYQSRIVGGVDALEGEFPWMAYLYNSVFGQYCGATLIAPEWAVTAAHCIWGISQYFDAVVVGDLHLSVGSEHHLSVTPADIFMHPQYDNNTFNADVALIKLSHAVNISDYVRPACLSQTLEELKDYKTCIITGWGNTEHDEADNLQKAVVRLIEPERCRELYGIPDAYDTDFLICAGFERGGIDTCQGDSGGPMVCEGSDGRWHLTGITSFGNGCADPGFPGVYARVSTLLPFIKSVLLRNVTETIRLLHGEPIELTSPNFPDDYSNDMNKMWRIIAPSGYSVAIDFPVFSLEDGYDVLIIYEGATDDVEQRELIYRLTGNDTIDRVISFGSYVWLQFTSDFIVQDQGFRLILSVVESIDCNDVGMFNCSNGRCVFANSTCDGFNDCLDFSDEEYCPPCVEVPEPCRGLVPHSLTYFPNEYTENIEHAQSGIQTIASDSSLSLCHSDIMEFACSAFFPECIHYGPTRRPCRSDCIEVTEFCQQLYQETLDQPWPINCTHFTDSQRDIDRGCLGGEGDYLNTTICGTRPAYSSDQSRVVGGVNAREGEFPWMVYLYNLELGQVCGGTLVGNEWVATAAHCVVDAPFSVDRIIIGDLLLSSASNHHLNITPAEIIPYPNYNTSTADGDFALIRLSQKVNFTDYVRPACLAESSEETKDYRRCTISGWGNTEAGFDADVLQKAIVHLITGEKCAELYPGQTTDLMICAGYERGGIDTCQGDSGGPLVCEGSDGRWHLVGATSWGDGCADPGKPGIYARVSQFLPFINQALTGNYTSLLPTPTLFPTLPPRNETETIMLAPGESEEIFSPNFPLEYDDNTDLTWHAIAPRGYSFAIEFISFDLENGYDNLIIYEGVTGDVTDRLQTHQLTGDQLPDQITTFGSYLWLRFVSDGTVSRDGFFLLLSLEEALDCNADGIFNCSNGRCIFQNSTCDGFDDCLDFSDEYNCPCDADVMFRCLNGLCISNTATCDGFNDCLDFSDEDYCPPCEDVPPLCRNIVPYSSTYFPNPYADSREVALEQVNYLDALSTCHDGLMELACSTFFPECIHYGPTRRPCRSDCEEVTESCQHLHQEVLGQPWPINCTQFTDSQQDTGGSCLGGEGDYLNTTICGTRPAYTPDQSRVVGGVNAKEGEFPWMVYLYDNLYGQFCGGTLIGAEWVATAAHCVDGDPFSVDRIVIGDLLLSSPSDHHLSIAPANIFSYPYYDNPPHHGDFALIRLSQKVNFTDYVRPACLAESSEETRDYRRCTVSGWGDTETALEADVLQKAIVHLITNERCAELYPGETTDLMICAGYERGGIDTCQGDSGGPLVCEGSDGRWHLVGATSWGDGCADPGKPGIYARISQFLPYINEALARNYSASVPSTTPFPVFTGFITFPTPEADLVRVNLTIGERYEITSPNYPDNYPDDTHEIWEIMSPVNTAILIHFIDFNLESGFDYLFLYSNDTLIRQISGSSLPRDMAEVTSKLRVRFQSDEVVSTRGFKLALTVVELPFNGSCRRSCCTDSSDSCNRGDCYCDVDCYTNGDCCWDFQDICEFQTPSTPSNSTENPGSTAIVIDLVVGEMTAITSPNFPDNYPNNAYVLWYVRAPTNHLVHVRFTEFSTEEGYDFLNVSGGLSPSFQESIRLATLSGNEDIDDIFSFGSYLWLAFSSDYVINSRGFRLVLTAVNITELLICSDGIEVIYLTSVCDGSLDCLDGSDERDCPPVLLAPGETKTITSREIPNYFDRTSLEWTVTSVEADLALVVKVEYLTLRLGDVISIQTIGADSGEDHVWTIEGPIAQDYSKAADKLFPSGDLLIQANTLNGTRNLQIEVMPAYLQDVRGCEGSDRLITPQEICDGIVDCPDFSDEQSCVPLETISLNLGQEATIQTPGYPDYLYTSLALQMTWVIQTEPSSRLRLDIQSFLMEASHTITIGTGVDSADDATIVFKVDGLPLSDETGTVIGDISPPGNAMWLRLEKDFTSTPSTLVLSATVEAVTEESLQCPSFEQSCGGVFPGCYNETSTCDGVNDCFDGSDENCQCPYILDVRCGPLNSCVHRLSFCDGNIVCGDDESTCTFVCDNGRVVSERFICDGYNDCGDFTDELQDCECAANQFDCGERCISMNDVCNEYIDCANGADEANCTCKSFEFQCDNGDCVPYWALCNGVDDCGDGSEELEDNCRYCPEHYFQCRDFSFCLSASSVCNSYDECKDGSDEWNCFPGSVTAGPTAPEPVPTPTESTFPTRQTLSFIPYEDCGLRPALDIHRVTHGEDVTGLGEFPWQIALYRPSGDFTCGGSVVSPEWILTAAHCVEESGIYSIKAGSLAYPKYEGGGQIRNVSDVFIHPGYNVDGSLSNDIALLKLASPLEITNEVQPICFPSMDEEIPKPGQYVSFTGWGSFTARYSPLPDLLQEGRMPVVPNGFCDHYIIGLNVLPSMFCTMYQTGYQGVCTGDSGGPIVQEINGRMTVVGISSWVEICGAPYIPNGFTRVSSFIDYVQNVMNEN